MKKTITISDLQVIYCVLGAIQCLCLCTILSSLLCKQFQLGNVLMKKSNTIRLGDYGCSTVIVTFEYCTCYALIVI